MSDNGSHKKVLVVTYYWYPYTGTGMYRISKFVKYLRKRGWSPVILTAGKASGNEAGEDIDPLLREVPVYRTPIFEPSDLVRSRAKDGSQQAMSPSVFYREQQGWLEKLAVWARLNVLIPDAKISWRFLAISKAKKVILQERPDLILSTSPPPTTNLVARKLARWSGLPWIADFRDPWTNIYYYDDVKLNPLAERINKSLEARVLADADRITVVNDHFFPDRPQESKTYRIPNGFDRDDFPEHRDPPRNDRFTICYTGSLKMNQFPQNLIEALEHLSAEEPAIAKNSRLVFYGHIEPRFRNAMEAPGIKFSSEFPGLVPRDRALQAVVASDMQLLLIGKSPKSKPVLSTKVFEYMLSGKPVLGIGHPDGAAAELVRETGIGRFSAHDDTPGVINWIKDAYHAWDRGEEIINPDSEAIRQYDFDRLTARLEEIMKTVITHRST